MVKYNKDRVQRICKFIRDGDTQKVAAERAGISETAFYEWMNGKIEFAEEVKKAREDFQETIVAKLEATLYRKAQGYEVTETDTEFVNGKDGKPIIKSQKKKIKHIQPDTGALIFALTNLAPGKWVNRQRVDNTILTKDNGEYQTYHFEDLPDDLLFDLADKLQDAEKKRAEEKRKQ